MKCALFGILLAAIILCGSYGHVVKRSVNPRCYDAPADPGGCFGGLPSFTYYQTTDSCELFVYGGCGGNGNRFQSPEECESACKP